MSARWSMPRQTDEFAWPGVPYSSSREPVRLRCLLAGLNERWRLRP